jgi:hypothetical protein
MERFYYALSMPLGGSKMGVRQKLSSPKIAIQSWKFRRQGRDLRGE